MSASGRTSTDPKPAIGSIPPMSIVLSLVAVLFLAGGALGLLSPETVPQLAAPDVAWSLIAVGIALDAAAAVLILLGARKPRRRRGD